MAKQATGELRILADGYAARITIKGRDRRDFLLTTCTDEATARARCTAMAEMAARLRRAGESPEEIVKTLEMAATRRPGRPWEAFCGGVDLMCGGQSRTKGSVVVPLYTDFAKDWHTGELAKKYPDHVALKRSSDRDEQLLRCYVFPHLRPDLRVDEFQLEDGETVMAHLPPHLAAGTRGLVAHVMARLMRLAVYPGKWRKDNPIPAGWMPRKGQAKAKECLYPDEDMLLLGGVSREAGKPDVPVLRRLAYGFLAREGMRTDEMAGLRWRDVDLERGRVHLDTNKTDDPRDWDLRPDVVEALTFWKGQQTCTEPGDYVFADNGVPLHVKHLADLLRGDLRRVGVTRPQLFERSEVRQPLRAHDLRATFVTIGLATGKTETWISDRTGHQSHKMIDAYRRKARTWNLGELGPLSDLIPELRGRSLPHALPHGSTPQPNSHTLNRKCIGSPDPTVSRSIVKTRIASDPGSAEIARAEGPQGQSRGNDGASELEAAIANMTRLLSTTDDAATAADFVAERRAMRAELEALRRPANVTSIRRATS